MATVSLACYLHDPNGGLLKPIGERLPLLKKIYGEMHVVATDASDDRIIEHLEENGCRVVIHHGGVGLEHVGDSRRMTLRAAQEGDPGHIHFIEMDRVLQWAGSHPEELRRVVGEIPGHDFLVIGRTSRAFGTHPLSQRETEGLTNRVCSLILGRNLDVTAASRGLSREAAGLILRYSKAGYCETDSEWPIIIHCKSGMPIGYVEVDGLGFEDWLQRPEEVEEAGGLEAWKRAKDEDPAAWLHRIRFAQGISETALRTYRELCQGRS